MGATFPQDKSWGEWEKSKKIFSILHRIYPVAIVKTVHRNLPDIDLNGINPIEYF